MSPFEHGELFVLDDGGEVDLDLGNYEHFLDVTLMRDNNITTRKIYQSVINKERKGRLSWKDCPGPCNFCLVHVSLIPVLNVVGKQKTKPTQYSVRGVRGLGLTLNILACRSTTALDDNVKRKLSQFCHSGLALLHASVGCRKKLVVDWVEASHLEDITAKEDPDIYRAAWNCLKGADGILVPRGFGDRGVQGKILAAKYVRESKVPFLGICLGMQIVVIE
ncbi:hypothetical protein REPUB_Repub08aG0086000 [Reevesia pubescens]